MLATLFATGILGFILCFIYILVIWKCNFKGDGSMYSAMFEDSGLNLTILRTGRLFNPGFPDDDGFWSLRFSASRHLLVFLVSGSMIYYLDIAFLNLILLLLNWVYTALKVRMQQTRKKLLKNETAESKRVYRITVLASAGLTAYCCLLCLLLCAVYIVRP